MNEVNEYTASLITNRYTFLSISSPLLVFPQRTRSRPNANDDNGSTVHALTRATLTTTTLKENNELEINGLIIHHFNSKCTYYAALCREVVYTNQCDVWRMQKNAYYR